MPALGPHRRKKLMRRSGLRLSASLIVLVAGFGFTAIAQKRPTAPWPLPVQKVAEIAPPLSPEDELKTLHLPPGYHAELVASEPLVKDPIWVDFDADGRMYVLEMPGFAMDKSMADSREPIGRIAVLEDTNNDGKMDKRTVFIDGLVLPRALKVLDGGVLVGEPPNLWFAKDTDGDLKADTKELVRNDYGRLEGNLEHNANSSGGASTTGSTPPSTIGICAGRTASSKSRRRSAAANGASAWTTPGVSIAT